MEPIVVTLAILAAGGAIVVGWTYRYFSRRLAASTAVERAYDAYDRGLKDHAAHILEGVLRQDPDDETALYLRVLIDLETRHPSAIAEELRPRLPAMKRVGGTALLVAQAFLRLGDERSARHWYDVARTDPGFEVHLEAMPLRNELAMKLGEQERSYA